MEESLFEIPRWHYSLTRDDTGDMWEQTTQFMSRFWGYDSENGEFSAPTP
jgi:hypothetical protein